MAQPAVRGVAIVPPVIAAKPVLKLITAYGDMFVGPVEMFSIEGNSLIITTNWFVRVVVWTECCKQRARAVEPPKKLLTRTHVFHRLPKVDKPEQCEISTQLRPANIITGEVWLLIPSTNGEWIIRELTEYLQRYSVK